MNSETIFINQFHTGCLSQFSYYIESEKEAIIVDPMREYKPYLDFLSQRGATLKYILQTHIHSDFVSGHLDLAKKTEAQIVYGPGAECNYPITIFENNDERALGNIKIKALHTPGHTVESTCYAVIDSKDKVHSVFTGDTLLLGSIAGPDLSQLHDKTERELAIMHFNSISNVIAKLPDSVVVYPGHSNGTFKALKIKEGVSSTIGEEKVSNPYLRAETVDDFINLMIQNMTHFPQYIHHSAKFNKEGYDVLDDSIHQHCKPLKLEDFQGLVKGGSVIVDTRDPESISKGYIPGSLLISLKSPFSRWTGTLLKPSDRIVLITDDGRMVESVVRLLRIGYYEIAGYLKGGYPKWQKASLSVSQLKYVSEEDVPRYLYDSNKTLIDFREEDEYDVGKLPFSIMCPLSQIYDNYAEVPTNKNLYAFCKTGLRAIMGASILENLGYQNITILQGGFLAMSKQGIKFVK